MSLEVGGIIGAMPRPPIPPGEVAACLELIEGGASIDRVCLELGDPWNPARVRRVLHAHGVPLPAVVRPARVPRVAAVAPAAVPRVVVALPRLEAVGRDLEALRVVLARGDVRGAAALAERAQRTVRVAAASGVALDLEG